LFLPSSSTFWVKYYMRPVVRFFFIIVFLGGIFFMEIGCQRLPRDFSTSSEDVRKGETHTVFDQVPEAQSLLEEKALVGISSVRESSDSSTGGPSSRPTRGEFLGIEETVSVQSILDRMVSAYQKARTYRDLGEITLQWKQNGIVHERRTIYRTSFQRPNGLLLEVGQTQILANGNLLCAYTPEMAGLVLQKPCPKELSLYDLLYEQEIYWAITDVESSRFCSLPPPLVFLLSPQPLKTFLNGESLNVQPQLDLLDSRKIKENECFRIALQENGEETIFWIDAQSFILRRVELPKQILKKEATDHQKQEEMSVTLDFHGAEFNWVGVLEMKIPENSILVSSFSEPQINILGKPFPKCLFLKLDVQDSTAYDFQGKTLFGFFWSVYSPNPFKFQDLERLYKQFSNVPDFEFLGINIDPPNVSNEKIRTTAAKFGLTCPLARISEGTTASILRRDAFSCFLVDSKGIFQFCDGLNSFHPTLHYAQKIQAVLEGKEIYEDLIKEIQEREESFHSSIRQWVENGIFLKDVESNAITMPVKKILPASEPILCEKKEIWFNSEVKSPSCILPFPQKKSILVLENGNSVAEVNLEGKVVRRHELKLQKNDFLTKIQIFKSDEPEKTYFALLGRRFYLYDSDWKQLMVYPPQSQESLKNALSDAILADLDQDGKPEIYVAFQNETGIRKLALDGRELGKNETVSNIFQFAIVQTQGKKDLRTVDQSGKISIFNPQNLQWVQTWEIPQRTLNSLVVSDFDGDGTDALAATAISPSGKVRVVGISEEGKEIWNIDLPDFLYQRNIQKIQPFSILYQNEPQSGWGLLGAESSVFLVEPNGLLMDQFQFGKIITGCASAVFDGKPILFMASPDGVSAMEIKR